MPKEAAASEKEAASAKAPAKKRVGKGESVVCEVCGLAVVVEDVGGIAVSEETTLLCCGKPMRVRKAPAKARKAK